MLLLITTFNMRLKRNLEKINFYKLHTVRDIRAGTAYYSKPMFVFCYYVGLVSH